jgi:hypothetical protein
LGDLIHSGLKYGSHGGNDEFLRGVEFEEPYNLNLHRFECEDHEKVTESDTIFVATNFLAQYIPTRIRKTSDDNLLYSLDESVFSSNCVFLFPTGHPVTASFNVVIRRILKPDLGLNIG